MWPSLPTRLHSVCTRNYDILRNTLRLKTLKLGCVYSGHSKGHFTDANIVFELRSTYISAFVSASARARALACARASAPMRARLRVCAYARPPLRACARALAGSRLRVHMRTCAYAGACARLCALARAHACKALRARAPPHPHHHCHRRIFY